MMTAQQLKNSILQRAIEGKLVEQRAEEGTAKELLKEIKLEKEKLVKEGKIKKSKALPPITEDEIPFDIPDSWEWVRLGNIGDWGSGATPKRHHPEYYGGNIPWLKTGDLNDGIIERIPESITQEGFDNSSVRLNPIGSVLMAMYGATIGKLGILNIPATTNQACCACILFAGLSPKYLFYHLMSQRKNFIKLGEGGAQPNISKEKIVNYLIPIPPLSEQHRIVAKIEELMPLVDQYDKAYSQLTVLNEKFPQDMKKSILQYAIEGKLVEQRPEEGTAKELLEAIKAEKAQLIKDKKIKKSAPLPPISEDEIPFDVPEGWEWVRFAELVTYSMGKTPPRKDEQYWGSDVKWVSISDMRNNSTIKETKESISEYAMQTVFKNQIAPVGTLLMSFKLSIGKVSILEIDAVHNEAIISIYPIIKKNDIMRDYLFKILPLIAVNGDFKTAIKGKTLNSSSINNLLIPLPPLSEQKRIVAKIEELMPLCDKLVKTK